VAKASDPRVLVLVTLRLGAVVPAAEVARRSGVPTQLVEALLGELEGSGQARSRQGRVSGWMLTGDGRAECHRLVRDEAASDEMALDAAYRGFLGVNQRLIDTCTAWQLRTVDGVEVPNDHADVAHDAAVLAELDAVAAVAEPVCEQLGHILERLSGYGARLAEGRARVRAGETDWLTSPAIDSYHTVWFELHENLLMTLGIERGQERPEPSTPLQEAR
jgi:hypothetical protein